MTSILSRRGGPALERIARGRTLLVFDYDGTLAPIVADRGRAQMRARTSRLLTAAASRFPTAVVSGRARSDVAGWLSGVPLRAIVGNHGLEWPGVGRRARHAAARVRDWRRRLEREVGDLSGVEIEDKGLSLSLHYRTAPDRRAAASRLRALAGRLAGARLVVGKCVLNVVAEGAPHKGDAVEQLRRRLRCELAVFVGDDRTDEDAFSLASSGHLIAIRVGRSCRSRAEYYLADQEAVDTLLERLVALRPPPRAPGAASH